MPSCIDRSDEGGQGTASTGAASSSPAKSGSRRSTRSRIAQAQANAIGSASRALATTATPGRRSMRRRARWTSAPLSLVECRVHTTTSPARDGAQGVVVTDLAGEQQLRAGREGIADEVRRRCRRTPPRG